MKLLDEIRGPASPHRPEEGKIVVLKEKDGDAALLVERKHLLHYGGGFSGTDYLAGRGAIEGLNGTEGAGAGAAAAGEQGDGFASERGFGLEVANGIRQAVEIIDQGTHRSCLHAIALAECDALHGLPLASGSDAIRQFQERHFPLEANHAVEFGEELKIVAGAEAGEMSAHGEVAADACLAQQTDEAAVLGDVELEDQREADDHRVEPDRSADDLFRLCFDVANDDRVAMLPESGRQIADAEIALVLKPDQQDGTGRVARNIDNVGMQQRKWMIHGHKRSSPLPGRTGPEAPKKQQHSAGVTQFRRRARSWTSP